MTIGRFFVNLFGIGTVTQIMNGLITLKDGVKETFIISANIMQALTNYLNGTSNVWLFLQEFTTPIPSTCIENNVHVVWKFNTSTKTLVHTENENQNNRRQTTYFLPWLSASIYCNDELYNFDSLGEQFTYDSDENIHPTPKLLLHCWSIINKKWFTPDKRVYFEVIDHNGNVHQCPVYNRSRDDIEVWRNLFNNEEESEKGEEESQVNEEESEQGDEESEQGEGESEKGEEESQANEEESEKGEEESQVNEEESEQGEEESESSDMSLSSNERTRLNSDEKLVCIDTTDIPNNIPK
jgi:flagellar biosynthesis GTPase FlhF